MSMNAEVMPITPPTLMFISAVSPARSAAGALRFLYSMMPALFISTSSLGKLRLHARCEGGDLSGIRDVALDGVNLRVLRFHLIEHRLAPTSHDYLVAEFEELECKSKADAGGAPGYENSATFQFHKSPFVTTVHGNGFDFLADRNGVSPHELTLGCRMLHWIITIIQWLQKNSKAVQKMASHTRQHLLPVCRLGKKTV